MKRVVEFARFHAGVSIGSRVTNGAKPGKEDVLAVHLVDHGVVVTSRAPGKTVSEDLVPFGNIISIRLAPDEAILEEPSAEKPKPKAKEPVKLNSGS